MAQTLKNITISAPSFKGLNTQDSPLSDDPQFASVADNVVVDNYGRLGARKGLETVTTNASVLNGNSITTVHEYEDATGGFTVLSVGNNKIFSGDTTLTDITPSGYTITDEDFKFINFNDKCYIINNTHAPLVYDTTNGLRLVSSTTEASGTFPQGNIGISAFGRLWVMQGNIVYWSDLLIGEAWDTGSSGSIDLDKVWADGSDTVTGLAVWNNYLVIFGLNSAVIYQGAQDPATMSLADTVSGVGCVSQNTIQAVGNDLLFLSYRGVMALGRTIQEKSNPINDVSVNVKDDIVNFTKSETGIIKSVYSPSNRFYLIYFPTSNIIYCFDTKGYLETGGYRVTRWVTKAHRCFFNKQDDTLIVGNTNGISEYSGYTDNGMTYPMRYQSNPLSFGDSSIIKFLKKITVTFINDDDIQAVVNWGYNFNLEKQGVVITSSPTKTAYYNEAEFNTEARYNFNSEGVTTRRVNTNGSGNLVFFGLESNINGSQFSIQEFNIQATVGRIY